MRKLLSIMLFLLLGGTSKVSAQEMRALFMTAPDNVLPMLSGIMRADLVDYVDAGMKAKVTNLLDGVSRLDTLSTDYLFLRPSASSSIQMALLPYNESHLVCVINSVKAEVEDSRIDFYDLGWNRIENNVLFTPPAIRDFFHPSDTVGKYVDMCDMYLVSLKLGKPGNILVAEYTMPGYMNEDDARVVAPLLRRLVYRWTSDGFVCETAE